MLPLRGNLDEPGSDLVLILLAELFDITEAIGSISSRSGLGICSGAKSDLRKFVDAIRTVAAAKE